MVTQIYKIRSEIWVAPSPSEIWRPQNIKFWYNFAQLRNLIANISGTQQDVVICRLFCTLLLFFICCFSIINDDDDDDSENSVANYGHSRIGKFNLVYFGRQTAKSRTRVLTHPAGGHQAGHCHASSLFEVPGTC